MADKLVLFIGNNNRSAAVGVRLLQHFEKLFVCKYPVFGGFRRFLFKLFNILRRVKTAGQVYKMLHFLFAHIALPALQFCNDLVDLIRDLFLAVKHFKPVNKLFK